MGAGAAKAVRDAYPEAYNEYIKDYSREGLVLGRSSWVMYPEVQLQVVNLYTQFYYGREEGRRYTDYEAVARTLEETVKRISKVEHYKNFQFPKIGCNLGGGRWEVVSAIIDTVIPDTYRKLCFSL